MSQNQTKRFYWLRLHNDFFNRDDIRIIKNMPNGKDYLIFYLELMLKSINDNGRLIFKGTIPYTPEMLASITQTSIDTVRVAIDAFVKIGLIEILDDGALFMQEVQKLVGSETADAQRKRDERATKIAQPKLSENSMGRTLSKICPENVTLENKSVELKNKSPYLNGSSQQINNSGIINLWIDQIHQLGYSFTELELATIGEWASYKAAKNQSISIKQITLAIEILVEHKSAGYDIVRMIKRSIANGYAGIMTPSKDFLVTGTKSAAVTGRYASIEYITPESSTQKIELRNYLERCYMRDKVDPRTKKPFTSEQSDIFRQHYKQSKSLRISITDYIYRYEVLSGICLLEQPIESKSIGIR